MYFLLTLLTEFVRFRQLGEVFAETIEMYLGDRARVPDLMFVRAARLNRVGRRRLDGPADLAIELISDDSVERDNEEKLGEYAAAGVTEYWVLDARDDAPDLRPPAFYHLVDGVYQPIPLDAEGRLWSTVVDGFWLRPELLEQDPPPDPLLCLDEIDPTALDIRKRRTAAAGETSGSAT
jgi:Uma2 family endonuclease